MEAAEVVMAEAVAFMEVVASMAEVGVSMVAAFGAAVSASEATMVGTVTPTATAVITTTTILGAAIWSASA